MRRARYVGSKVKDVGNAVLSASSFAMPTLGGAVDVLAVRQPDGSLRCSPFYVRFGKYQGLLRSREKRVRIEVEGKEVEVTMQLGRSGEAYFVASRDAEGVSPLEVGGGEEEARMLDEWIRMQDEEIAMELDAYDAMEEMDGILSPRSGYSSGEEPPYATAAHAGPISQAEAKAVLEATKEGAKQVSVNVASSPRARAAQLALQQAGEEENDLPTTSYSSTATECASKSRDSTETIKSMEFDGVQVYIEVISGSCRVNVQVIPSSCYLAKPLPRGARAEQDYTSPDAAGGDLAVHRRLFPEPIKQDPLKSTPAMMGTGEEPSTPLDYNSPCGGSEGSGSDEPLVSTAAARDSNDKIEERQINAGELDHVPVGNSMQIDCSYLAGNGLELSMCGHLLEAALGEEAMGRIFAAHLITPSVFQEDVHEILRSPNLVCRVQGQYVPFQMFLPALIGGLAYKLPVSIPRSVDSVFPTGTVGKGLELAKEVQKAEGWSKIFWPFSRSTSSHGKQKQETTEERIEGMEIEVKDLEDQQIVIHPRSLFKGTSHRFRRSLTPTSEQLGRMGLQDGRNLITFTFKTSMWGIQQVQCYLYLIDWDSKLVVTDVDGTITKSDMLGHLMPIVGKDWSHSGVANLFTNIRDNGYVVMYLSSRAIGQATRTRDYLMNVIQDGEYLPYGPVLMSPDGIFPSLYREVVLKRPHEFKINCLQNVKSLFPEDWSPFYAGFGNRPTDQLSYEAVGIPRVRIFTINSKSEVVSAASTVKGAAWSSFKSINSFVDHMFPSIEGKQSLHEEFGDVNFWRIPVMELPEEVSSLLLESPSEQINESTNEETQKSLSSPPQQSPVKKRTETTEGTPIKSVERLSDA